MASRVIWHGRGCRSSVTPRFREIRDRVETSRAVERPAPAKFPGIWDSELDFPGPNVASDRPVGDVALLWIARVGLALFVTTGFAAALNLYTGYSALAPGPLSACTYLFFWCLACFPIVLSG